jgi:serine/threonine protein kinase
MVLVFEALGSTIYKEMKERNFIKMEMNKVKTNTYQVVLALQQLKKVGIIHCDLKPENLIYVDEKCVRLKVIDFGSSCFNYKDGFSYVQSRYYRAPEIVLGLPYTCAADMWSLGCIVAEMVMGRPLFPAIDENELVECF